MYRLSLLLLCLATACSPIAVPQGKVPAVVSLSAGITYGGEAWRQEFARAHHRDCRVIVCHGTDDGHQWVLCPDAPYHRLPVADVARLLHAVEPETEFLFVVCNEGQYAIDTPKIWTAPGVVWTVPGSPVRMTLNLRLEEAVGSINDFHASEGK